MWNWGNNSWWWIIILLLILGWGNNGCGCGCDNGCNNGCGCDNIWWLRPLINPGVFRQAEGGVLPRSFV